MRSIVLILLALCVLQVYGDHINRPDGLEPTASQVVDDSVTADGADKSTSADEEEGDAAGLRRLMGRHPSLDLTHVLPPNWTPAEKRPMAGKDSERDGRKARDGLNVLIPRVHSSNSLTRLSVMALSCSGVGGADGRGGRHAGLCGGGDRAGGAGCLRR